MLELLPSLRIQKTKADTVLLRQNQPGLATANKTPERPVVLPIILETFKSILFKTVRADHFAPPIVSFLTIYTIFRACQA
jgi:hypothetical protein